MMAHSRLRGKQNKTSGACLVHVGVGVHQEVDGVVGQRGDAAELQDVKALSD